MGRKTRRFGTLKRLIEQAIDEAPQGVEFTSRELANKLEPAFGVPITSQVIGAILGQLRVKGLLIHHRPFDNESWRWIKK